MLLLRALFFLVSLSAVFSHAFATDFKTCSSNGQVSITTLTLTPSVPIVGENLQITLDGHTDVVLDRSTKVDITISAFGVQVATQSYGLCDLTSQCNVPVGDFELSLQQAIPSQAPAGIKIDAQVSVKNGATTVSCVDVTTEIKAKTSELYLEMLFNSWKEQHQKEYHDLDTHYHRFQIFKENLAKIESHNSRNQDVRLALNHLGDLTSQEYSDQYLNPVISRPTTSSTANPRANRLGMIYGIPDSVDWVAQGKVSEVKNQGQCGSCWSFSTTGSLESAYAIQNNQMITLSEQQLVDCSGSYGNQGCNGGLMDQAFKYVQDHGLTTEDAYPYTAADGTCRTDVKSVISLDSYVDVKANDEVALKKAVAQQPVAIAIEADQFTFQFYHTGVLKKGTCGTNLDHGVLLVGYGEEDGTKYWKVKNSWGATWGAEGYILLERTDDTNTPGTCGVATTASYPVLSKTSVMSEQ